MKAIYNGRWHFNSIDEQIKAPINPYSNSKPKLFVLVHLRFYLQFQLMNGHCCYFAGSSKGYFLQKKYLFYQRRRHTRAAVIRQHHTVDKHRCTNIYQHDFDWFLLLHINLVRFLCVSRVALCFLECQPFGDERRIAPILIYQERVSMHKELFIE